MFDSSCVVRLPPCCPSRGADDGRRRSRGEGAGDENSGAPGDARRLEREPPVLKQHQLPPPGVCMKLGHGMLWRIWVPSTQKERWNCHQIQQLPTRNSRFASLVRILFHVLEKVRPSLEQAIKRGFMLILTT